MTHLLHIPEMPALFCPSLGSSFSHQLWIGFNIFRRWWFYLAQATSEFYAQFDFDIVPGSGWVGFFKGGPKGVQWGQRSDSWQAPAACRPLHLPNFPTFLGCRCYCAIKMHKHKNKHKQQRYTNLCKTYKNEITFRPVHMWGKHGQKRKRSHVKKGQ